MGALPDPSLDPASRRVGGGSGGQVAKDALGNNVKASSWLTTHLPGDRSLAQGLKVCGRPDVQGAGLEWARGLRQLSETGRAA